MEHEHWGSIFEWDMNTKALFSNGTWILGIEILPYVMGKKSLKRD